ncbi:CASP-like protein 1B1 [Ananas comosus]|uniref:CASP-like protein n=2 Tax=Ananas comosus TaxID=4615 RepID=A0A6P5FG04_ANACO|nr:CASP-like protein 1B1 [Ananas comosus]
MAIENGKGGEIGSSNKYSKFKAKMTGSLPVVLRVAILLATGGATLGMGLNKQSKTAVVAVVGTTPISQTFVAQFQDTPAFVYFVIANAIASFYNLLVLVLQPHLKGKAHNIWVLIFDMVVMTVVATGAAAAASIAELGKNGNQHARWNPICDNFGAFCCRGAIALAESFVGSLLLLILNVLSTVTLRKNVAAHD